MSFDSIEAIADAVLFEGYMLYPYRPTSLKNRQRWNFGTLYPRNFAEAQSPRERFSFSTQVLLEANSGATLNARVRFLQLIAPVKDPPENWDEGFARSRTLMGITIGDLVHGVDELFDLSQLSAEEQISAPPNYYEKPRVGRLCVRAAALRDGLYRLAVSFSNESCTSLVGQASCRAALQDQNFTSAHLLLEVEDGKFVSLLEPPTAFEDDARACVQDGVFPVLVDKSGERRQMLCSPIILYDYPEVAPESAGNFFDSTEMDEMLTLRVLTLTDEEKEEMRESDSHARAILERTEKLPDQQLARVHGAVRGLRRVSELSGSFADNSIDMIDQPFDPVAEYEPVNSVRVFRVALHIGDRVRLWPQKKADILDMEMEGKIAIVEAIEQDLENHLQLAVVLEDDPGRDMGMLRQAGHRFFFSPEEVEPVRMEVS